MTMLRWVMERERLRKEEIRRRAGRTVWKNIIYKSIYTVYI